jgi:DNA polymerase-3 subunit alpha (Gram-positive type)
VAQAFPEAMKAGKAAGVKVIYGMEAYLIDDLRVMMAKGLAGKGFDETVVVFDLETTGLAKEQNSIIEIGAVRIENGKVAASFSSLVNPYQPLSEKIVELTGITDAMLANQRPISEVLPEFLDFIGGSVLAAHNAEFDVGFLRAEAERLGIGALTNGYVCTVDLSRMLYPDLGSHKLNVVARHLGIPLANHHRAIDDAAAAGGILLNCFKLLRERGADCYDKLNELAASTANLKNIRHTHAVILVRNTAGLRNLYELISHSHIKYFHRRPRIPKSEFNRLREGLLIGTACESGELHRAVLENKPETEFKRIADFYDYFEIQPTGNNGYMIRNGTVEDGAALQEINRKIVGLGEMYGKPVIAATDAHFLHPEDEVYRRIIMHGDGFKDADNQAPLFFRTTGEMLDEFAYLGAEKAYEVVVTNTNLINDLIDAIKPIPDGTYPPVIAGAEPVLEGIISENIRAVYGDPLPGPVALRIGKEMDSIIKNGFAGMYLTARRLVRYSEENGYVVGSRGSIGSSLAATVTGITEVNPLPAHYYCKGCRYADFDSDVVGYYAQNGLSGVDMPDADCPVCGAKLVKEGHDIPFETFLGFDGDKEPDIDLNFSGEFQSRAHAFTEELFGADYVFRAGTIGTLAEKTVYGYVKKYLEEHNITVRRAEEKRLEAGCVGVKKSTGQHPGGLIVVPEGKSIYDFTPIQRPANDMKTNAVTTHFDFRSALEGRLFKLDLLGHKVPTMIRMLHDITGIDPIASVDLGDKTVLSLLTSPKALGVSARDIDCPTGTLGLPELGTKFTRQMLAETQPTTFSELIGISGLSHGTNVWVGNAQELIKNGTATLKNVITTRDGIMLYLISKGIDNLTAFTITELVRKGKNPTEAHETLMRGAGVPEWYIESCRRIEYLFPKGHATAYVMMAVRIGWFKIYHPYAFYAASFSVDSDDFDFETMCKGRETAQAEMRRITELINTSNDKTVQKEKAKQTLLELVLEMYARNLRFTPLDLYKSAADKFTVTENGLLPPLCTITGLGVTAADAIVAARADGEFFSVEDFKERTKTTKTVIEILKANGIFKGIPETAQLSFFDDM